MAEKEYISKEKYNELEKELQELVTTKRKEVAERLEYARSLGDLSENAEYHAARDDQGKIESRIEDLTNLLKYAEIIDHKKSDIVIVGSIVTLKKDKDDDKVTYTVVGKEESDLVGGKISYASPLGRAILGKKKKDKVSIETPKGVVGYTIIEIE
jgi:transcription elongation factor GreA